VRVFGSGGALKLEVEVPSIVSMWNPPNGFDHVAFTAFVALPGSDVGVAAMPLQHAELPGGMRWDYRMRAHGWSNALYSARGASATSEGTVATPAPDIRLDRVAHTVTFLLSSTALGGLRSLSGVRLYLATWDYDAGYRPLLPEADANTFSGGDGKADPLIMDDTVVITLP
jgi:hypothetical protein